MNVNDRQTQFNELLAECSRTFLATDKGLALSVAYARPRQSAQQNYDAIAHLDAQGIDITDAVILKLLPHTDTEQHRDQGAWIHANALITGQRGAIDESQGRPRRNPARPRL